MALTDNLLFYYQCNDNAANTTVDDAAGTADGAASANTSVLTTTGKINSGFSLTATSSHKITSASTGINGAEARTVSMWHNLSTTSGTYGFFSMGQSTTNRQFDLIALTGYYYFHAYGGSDIPMESYTVQTGWHHVAVTYDGTTTKVYLDGSEIGSEAMTLETTETAIWFGARTPGNTGYMTGVIDELAAWSRALSASEISQLYNSGNGLTYPFTGGGSSAQLAKVGGIALASIAKYSGIAKAGIKEVSGFTIQ